jgi:hypothetical protein
MKRTLEDLAEEIERRWAELDERPGQGLRIVDLPQLVGGQPVFLGVAADGSRLLVPFTKGEHRGFKAQKSRGVELSARELDLGESARWFIDVVCVRRDLRWLFSSFVSDLLLRLERHPEVKPAAVVTSSYSAWRALFASADRRMTLKQLAGLFGELDVLRRLLERSTEAVGRWRGPLRESHDFASPTVDLEVKTTLATEDSVVHIHGLDQLRGPEAGVLYLGHLRVEVPAVEGLSVPALIDELRPHDRTGRLAQLLAAAGYHEEHAEAYSGFSFLVTDEQWYCVDDDFPSLTSANFPGSVVPDAIWDVQYKLDLATLSAAPLSEESVNDVLNLLSA